MLISHGYLVKNVTLYPPTKSSHDLEKTSWIDTTNGDEENFQSIYQIDQIMQFKVLTEEDQIHSFLVHLDPLQNSDLSLDHFWFKFSRKIRFECFLVTTNLCNSH